MKQSLDGVPFLRSQANLFRDFSETDSAPMFRGEFYADSPVEQAEIVCCTLGFGIVYLNGIPINDHRFDTPCSDYSKTLWVRKTDVTPLLRPGKNVLAVWLGNGWYNESLPSVWNFHEAVWRDSPKFCLVLRADGKTVFSTAEQWKCLPHSAVTYNQLRSGETFDARLYDKNWAETDYDDSHWENALTDTQPPTGVFRECTATPVRECATYPAQKITKTNEDTYVVDFGQNMAGYGRFRFDEPAGTEITIRYSESDNPDGSLKYNEEMKKLYNGAPFATDKVICDGTAFTWSPRFVYHGFRFAEIKGLTHSPAKDSVCGVFVHNDTPIHSAFSSSDETLNGLFRITQMASLSNFFHMPTDCPTREKLGWTNDSQSSMEQFLLNFGSASLMKKWLQDIWDAMLPTGEVSDIVPGTSWGYGWGNGPVSDGVLFELPYQLWLQTGDKEPLLNSLPYFKRYLAYITTWQNEDGLFTKEGWLPDWTTPFEDNPTPAPLIHSVFAVKFYRITALAQQLAGEDAAETEEQKARLISLLEKRYTDETGKCRVDNQASLSLFLTHGIGKNTAVLKEQLLRRVEADNFHTTCGMASIRWLYDALTLAGRPDYAYRIITAKGYPSFSYWLDNGATTLQEYWDPTFAYGSRNHHMFSCFTGWIIRELLGVSPTEEHPGFSQVDIRPQLLSDLDWVEGWIETANGKIAVAWHRTDDGVQITVTVPENLPATLFGKPLQAGKNTFLL